MNRIENGEQTNEGFIFVYVCVCVCVATLTHSEGLKLIQATAEMTSREEKYQILLITATTTYRRRHRGVCPLQTRLSRRKAAASLSYPNSDHLYQK